MGSSADENERPAFPDRLVQLIDQQEVATDMAFSVAGPVPFEGVIKPFRPKRIIVGDQQQHRLLKAIEVIPTRAG